MLPTLSHHSEMVMLDYILHAVSTGDMKYHPVITESPDNAVSHLNKVIQHGAPVPPFVVYNDTLIHSPLGHPGWLYSMAQGGPDQPQQNIVFELEKDTFSFGGNTEDAVPIPDFYDFAFDMESLLTDIVDDNNTISRVNIAKDRLIQAKVPVVKLTSDTLLTPSVSKSIQSQLTWLFN